VYILGAMRLFGNQHLWLLPNIRLDRTDVYNPEGSLPHSGKCLFMCISHYEIWVLYNATIYYHVVHILLA